MCLVEPGDDEVLSVAEIKTRVHCAVERLFAADRYLLERRVHEQTITHRLAVHVQQLFGHWDVDCEYNKNLDQLKNLLGIGGVKPDIIVHRRGRDVLHDARTNFVAIEAKKAGSADPHHRDHRKLRGLMDPLGAYRFKVVAFLFLRVGPRIGATLVFGDDDKRPFLNAPALKPDPWFGTPRRT
jgi:hypothetical protein